MDIIKYIFILVTRVLLGAVLVAIITFIIAINTIEDDHYSGLAIIGLVLYIGAPFGAILGFISGFVSILKKKEKNG